MKLTRNGICYNLEESPYSETINYKTEKVKFIFSSDANLKRFNERIVKSREAINISLSQRFKFNISIDIISDIKLYDTIENRGFLILSERDSFECLEEITFDGVNLIKLN